MTEVTLSSAIRKNLLSLQKTATEAALTQEHLATGKKVSSATGNPTAYFFAKALTDRAGDMSQKMGGINQAISSLSMAATAMGSIEDLLKLMRGILVLAKQSDASHDGIWTAG